MTDAMVEMTDAMVEFLESNLNDLVLYHTDVIADARSHVKDLKKDIQIFQANFANIRENESIQMMVRRINDIVYEAEDIIDAYIIQAAETRARKYIVRAFNGPVNLYTIGNMVEAAREMMERTGVDFGLLGHIEENEYDEYQVRPPRAKDVVGFDGETEGLITRLTTPTHYFDVISIVGMLGLGKTTLAWKIFKDPIVLYEFPVRIWLSISQEFSLKDIFLEILKNFTTPTEYLRSQNEKELSDIILDYLEHVTFLIVMDDIWTRKDWDRLRIALPFTNKRGKVLITTREVGLARYASLPRDPVALRFLTYAESWDLLQLEALGHLDCPPELTSIGQQISAKCEGLPLSLVIIGGILATTYSFSDLGATIRAWEKVSTRVSDYLMNDPQSRMDKFISLSYDKLPYHLRPCFLYMGLFPEDYEIPVSNLIRMWIGEGFIQHNIQNSMEEIAEMYLNDLINRNLVAIGKVKPNGEIKTCRLHQTLLDFCRTEAGFERENFLEQIKCDLVFEPSFPKVQKYRRLSIHSNCLKFLSSKPFGPHIRSFVCIPKDEVFLPQVNNSAIPAAFKLLRVLDVKAIVLPKIPSDMYQLVHLRYIVFSFNLPTLPVKFSKLLNVQTLIVNTTSHNLEVEADMWKMKQLRHFKTNASAILLKPSRDNEHYSELQTLGTISAESCTAELLQQASNLKKLGIRGQLALLLEGKIVSFRSLVKLRKLEKLELINDVYPKAASEAKLLILPPSYHFPSTLRSLTLCATFVSWTYISSLGLLENLEVLKLKDRAFMGTTWEGVDGGFRRLEFLLIDHTDLVVWEASSHHFPRLKTLVLRNCDELRRIPHEFTDIPSFQMLSLYICRSAAASARTIREENIKKGCTNFSLSIFPANDSDS